MTRTKEKTFFPERNRGGIRYAFENQTSWRRINAKLEGRMSGRVAQTAPDEKAYKPTPNDYPIEEGLLLLRPSANASNGLSGAS